MSWIDKIKTELIITCGDGKQYKPQWINAVKTKDYNVAEFEFPEVSGTLVSRKKPKGSRYDLEIIFQGENNLDLSQAFEKSADDPRAWILSHPIYDRIIVQPLSLSFDNTKYNVTTIKIPVVETITEDYPKGATVPQDKIINDTEICNETTATATAQKLTATRAKPASVNKMKKFLAKVNAGITKFTNKLADAQSYFNAFNTAFSTVDNLVSAPLAAVRTAQAAITAPVKFQASVTQRMSVLKESLVSLEVSMKNSVVNLSDKILYETLGNTIISAMCETLATPFTGDYGNRNEVIIQIDNLIANYNLYITNLDNLQTDNGGTPTSYIADADSILLLSQLLNYTLSQLFNIALNAKQERNIILEYDSNWIILAHRFYGLKSDDSTINELIKNNNAGLLENLQVRKNRTITYYI